MLTGYLADFYLWGMLSPLIFWVVKRFELEKNFPRNLLIHIAVSVALSFVVLSAAAPVSWYLGNPNLVRNPTLLVLWRNNAFSIYYFHQGLTIYWATVAVAHAIHYYRGQREGEAKAGQLAAQLAQAQLQALKMQIHPHFLFNTLNSIAALLHMDVEAADKMIARLGDFLRLTLKRSDNQTVDFGQELEFLKCYLDIEHIRFQDRLTVDLDIDSKALKATVPNLILQPIVENAMRHAIARTNSGEVEISAVPRNGAVRIEVKDNGPGIEEPQSLGKTSRGVGLANTQARLSGLYGSNAKFELRNRPSGGLTVLLEIPRH